MKHLDLFSGIGGFALAADAVFGNVEHTFVEIDPFCQEILKKHWPESEVHHDIRQFITDTERKGWPRKRDNTSGQHGQLDRSWENEAPYILTGGFPCQPFSQAGKRKGTADDRPNGDALHCGDKCGIIGLCNGDTTTSVQDAGRTHDEKLGEDIANPVRPSTKRSGEQGTSNGGGQTIGSGVSNGSTRYTNDMEGNASVVEKRTMPSSPSTTSTEGGTRSEDNTTARHGNSSSRTDTPRHTKSSASTATTQNTISEPAPTNNEGVFLLTGGFPCQPFSQAGRRKGTNDERYLWPEMFRVIKLYQPQWVIAENVRGLTTWNEGMVLEQVCTDLESENYEVQPLIIPACSVNAPHRRERVWIIAHSLNSRQGRTQPEVARTSDSIPQKHRAQHSAAGELERTNSDRENDGLTTNSRSQRWERGSEDQSEWTPNNDQRQGWPDWSRDWQEVAFATCNDGVDDRIPRKLGNTTISFARWRREALKAYGNAIVPQVAMEIMEAIKLDDKRLT